MKTVREPVDVNLIKAELTPDKLLRKTNRGDNELYVFNAFNAPNTLQEVGRLRELAFRSSGGGCGEEVDLDEYDFMESPYYQLIVWDPQNEKILGGYRFIEGSRLKFSEDGKPVFSSAHLFNFSEKFIKEYLPNTIELGRSFVSWEYQVSAYSGNNSAMTVKALFALDNLWDGLAGLWTLYEGKYFFGKMTMYPGYPENCLEAMIYFLKKHFPDDEKLVVPEKEVYPHERENVYAKLFTEDDYKKDYRILKKYIHSQGAEIPPLVNSYMNLSPTMKIFGTGVNDEFFNAYDTGLLIKIEDIYPDKKSRHLDTFFNQMSATAKRILEQRKVSKLKKLLKKAGKLKPKDLDINI